MKFHEYANLFPMMPEMDLMRLAEDIKEKGQSDPVITLDGMIIDGRNRYKACEINGITPRCEEYTGDDPLGFVVSHNLHRRHMNESQRGMVGAKLANLQHGGQGGTLNSAIAPLNSVTQKQAAEMLNVGVDSIKRSKQVLRDGIPELELMQASGEISASAAAVVSQLPKEEQRKAVSRGVEAVKAKAKEIRDTPKREDEELETVIVDGTNENHQPTRRSPVKVVESEGLRIWLLAKSHLDRINKHDEFRIQALNDCIAYCQKRISSKK